MLHWMRQPKCSVVSTFVERYWLIEKKHAGDGFQFPKLNPDPSAHLIISPNEQGYSYTANGKVESGNGSHWLFPHLNTFQLDHRKPFIHLGIKFNVGALYSIQLSEHVHPTLDTVVSVDIPTLLGRCDLDLSSLLLIAQQDDAKCSELLDSLLSPWFSSYKQDKYSELTSKTLNILDTTPIANLGNELHCSQRTLERTFNRVTGFTLKQCQSMNRLEAMLEHLYSLSKEEIDWVDVAFKFGFSDQPHLIRYLKDQLGITPNKYATDRGLTIDAYGEVSNQ